jgi:hypothetical protein
MVSNTALTGLETPRMLSNVLGMAHLLEMWAPVSCYGRRSGGLVWSQY